MAKKKLLVAAVVVGALAAFLLFLYASQIEQEKKDLIGDQVEVVKAAREIPEGTALSKDLVRVELVPRRFLPPNPVMKSELNQYFGTPVSVNVQEGAMILSSDFSVAEVSKDLSSKIPQGERALSIAVNAISGVSGLLTPGDRVDVLGTFPVSDQGNDLALADGQKTVGYVTMTLLQNVTLLAVGQQVSSVRVENRQKGMYSSVTASVTIEEAELLTIAQTRGKLMFLLRNREDIEMEPVTRKSLREVLQDLELIATKRATKIKKKTRKPRLIPCPGNPSKKVKSLRDCGPAIETGR